MAPAPAPATAEVAAARPTAASSTELQRPRCCPLLLQQAPPARQRWVLLPPVSRCFRRGERGGQSCRLSASLTLGCCPSAAGRRVDVDVDVDVPPLWAFVSDKRRFSNEGKAELLQPKLGASVVGGGVGIRVYTSARLCAGVMLASRAVNALVFVLGVYVSSILVGALADVGWFVCFPVGRS